MRQFCRRDCGGGAALSWAQSRPLGLALSEMQNFMKHVIFRFHPKIPREISPILTKSQVKFSNKISIVFFRMFSMSGALSYFPRVTSRAAVSLNYTNIWKAPLFIFMLIYRFFAFMSFMALLLLANPSVAKEMKISSQHGTHTHTRTRHFPPRRRHPYLPFFI